MYYTNEATRAENPTTHTLFRAPRRTTSRGRRGAPSSYTPVAAHVQVANATCAASGQVVAPRAKRPAPSPSRGGGAVLNLGARGEQRDDERSTPRDERRRDGEVQRPQPRGEACERRRRPHRGARRHLRGGRDHRARPLGPGGDQRDQSRLRLHVLHALVDRRARQLRGARRLASAGETSGRGVTTSGTGSGGAAGLAATA